MNIGLCVMKFFLCVITVVLKSSAVDIYTEKQKYYHLPIMLSFNLSFAKKEIDKEPTFLYHKANWSIFKSKIDEKINSISLDTNIEDINEQTTNLMLDVENETIPKTNNKKSSTINLPSNILELDRLKNKYKKIAKKTNSPIHHENLNIIKVTLRSSLEEFH